MAKELWKGNEAIGEAAVRAGCDAYFGYPITPQSEVPEYLSWRMQQAGKIFLQSESEVATINMLYGAGGTGMKVMTTSSSPGIALMQEGMGYLAGAQVPAVIVNCMRGGPGLGTIQPGQADYNQMTRGGGNGDYNNIVLAPYNMQETVDFVQEAFDLASKYRNPVFVVIDGLIGQMMEPIEWKEFPKHDYGDVTEWAACGKGGRDHLNVINSLYLDPDECEEHNHDLHKKFKAMEENEVRYEEIQCDDAEIVIVAYGTPARIASTAITQLRAEGVKVGMFRPITLWPFAYDALEKLASNGKIKALLDVESCEGQMIDDVKYAVKGTGVPVAFWGRSGGNYATVEEIKENVMKLVKEAK